MSKKRIYRINCDCCSYKWERYPPRRFMRCRFCGRSLGDMQVEVVGYPRQFGMSGRKKNVGERGST